MAEISKHDVRLWWETVCTGKAHYTKSLDGTINIKTQGGTLRKIIYDLCHEDNPVVESCGGNDGYYIPIDNHAQPLDWQSLDARLDSGLVLPFDLRKYVFIYPDTTIVVAGSKSAGKTGFLYRTVVMNMGRVHVEVLTSLEGGLSMVRDRFNAMDVEIPIPAPFNVRYVTDHFHQYIKDKNTLYIIDYIDAPEGSDFYMIGAQIKKIDQKLQGLNSNAVIGLQKPLMRDTAFGGEQTLKAPTLYLAMDAQKLKIVDAKVPECKDIHPKGLQWSFQYSEEGTQFLNIQPYYEEL